VPDLHPDRALVVTASEAAAMMGADEHRSPYALWAVKAGLAEPDDLDGNDPVFWGTVLEPAVAEGVRRRTGWDLRLCQRFIRHASLPLGATPDYLIVPHDEAGVPLPYAQWGVCELKTMDLFRWLKLEPGTAAGGPLDLEQDPSGAWQWRRPKKEPPAAYQVQVQVQLACTGLQWGVLAVLVGGNRLELFRYDRHEGAIAAIGARAVEFMRLVREKESGDLLDWERDADTVRDVYKDVANGKIIEGDAELEKLARRYQELGKAKDHAENDRAIVAAKILATLGNAEEAHLPGGDRITASVVGPTRVEAYDRKAYRPVYVRGPRKEKGRKR
jgi:hypothetical protein